MIGIAVSDEAFATYGCGTWTKRLTATLVKCLNHATTQKTATSVSTLDRCFNRRAFPRRRGLLHFRPRNMDQTDRALVKIR